MKKNYRKIILSILVIATVAIGISSLKISGPGSRNQEPELVVDQGAIVLEDDFQEEKKEEVLISGDKEEEADEEDTDQDVQEKDNVSESSTSKPTGDKQGDNDSKKKKNESSKSKEDKKNDDSTKNETDEEKKEKYITCTISIDCSLLIDGVALKENGNENKQSYVPEDGKIVSEVKVKIKEGSSVFDVLRIFCKKKHIQLEANYSAGFGGYYVEGINHLYEFDGGSGSGWVYFVNGQMPNYGASDVEVSQGDKIVWMYTLDYGYDVSP